MRDYKLYLDDMLEATKRAEKHTKGATLEKLKKNTLILDGIVRNLEIIGEAAKNIPSQIKEKYPEIEWKKSRDFVIFWRTSISALIWKWFGISSKINYRF